MSVQQGLKDVCIFVRRTPRLGRIWLKDFGNLTNDIVVTITFLEVYRSTEAIDNGFERLKKKNMWSVASVGQAALEAKGSSTRVLVT